MILMHFIVMITFSIFCLHMRTRFYSLSIKIIWLRAAIKFYMFSVLHFRVALKKVIRVLQLYWKIQEFFFCTGSIMVTKIRFSMHFSALDVLFLVNGIISDANIFSKILYFYCYFIACWLQYCTKNWYSITEKLFIASFVSIFFFINIVLNTVKNSFDIASNNKNERLFQQFHSFTFKLFSFIECAMLSLFSHFNWKRLKKSFSAQTNKHNQQSYYYQSILSWTIPPQPWNYFL